MTHADRPTPSGTTPAPPSPPRVRALVGVVARVTYPYLLGGSVGCLALTVVSRDIALMGVGAFLVLYGVALVKAVQGRPEPGGANGAQ